jgi:hypothetical protein
VWRTSVAWWDRLRVALAPGPAARRGAIWAIVSLLGIFVAIHLIFLPSGYGIPSPETGRDSAEVRSNCDRGDLHQRNRIGMGLNAMTVTSMIQQSSR